MRFKEGRSKRLARLATEFIRVDDVAMTYKPADPPHSVCIEWVAAYDELNAATRDMDAVGRRTHYEKIRWQAESLAASSSEPGLSRTGRG